MLPKQITTRFAGFVVICFGSILDSIKLKYFTHDTVTIQQAPGLPVL
jgi:hypothetical protein